ncbi:SLC13 family permease [Halobacteria archaeon AArc-curdl1]|uniref:SLC13 family permease n=1 Tax=Natronosalvus hydrolyticus TaxID=2979988 RepID=A0AAP2Z7F5_9EURY|nr:SLC13 family permease [Halobacteria archaeon AArc-curdl1]
MLEGISTGALVVFALIAVALVLFVSEVIPNDMTAVGIIVALALLEPLTGVGSRTAISGFANTATITIVAMYMLSAGIQGTGLVQRLGVHLAGFVKGSDRRALLATIATTGPIAGFINNTPVVAIFIPMIAELAEKTGVSPSKLLLPLSYAAILGGTLTLIGTSTNLLASEFAVDLLGRDPIGMFEFTALGLIILLVGLAYLATVGWWLTPARVPVDADLVTEFDLEDHLAKVRVGSKSPAVGLTIGELEERSDANVRVLQLRRGTERPGTEQFLEYDDETAIEGEQGATLEADGETDQRTHPESLGEHEQRLPTDVPNQPETVSDTEPADTETEPEHAKAAFEAEHPNAENEIEHTDAGTEAEHTDAGTETEHTDAGTETEHTDAGTEAEHIDPPLETYVGVRSDQRIREGDVLTLHGTLQAVNRFADDQRLRQLPRVPVTESTFEDAPSEDRLAKVVVPTDSPFIGKSLEETRLRSFYRTTVLALRRDGKLRRKELQDVRLEAGDVLLVQTIPDTIEYLARTNDLVVIEEDAFDRLLETDLDELAPLSAKTPIAVTIMAGVIGTAALGLAPIVITALAGVFLMVVTGCLSTTDAYDAVSWNIIFLLAGVIPLGIALEATGGSQVIANGLVGTASVLPLVAVLLLFFLVTGLLANVITPVATVVLMIPVAVDAASSLGASQFSFLLAVMFASATSFMTPVGYQTNLMVYGPGGYEFTDFLKVGGPLQLLLAVVTTLGIVSLWGL